MPPTERKGRVHTSTVTVACLNEASPSFLPIENISSRFECVFFSGTGAGGQHRNKSQNSVRVTDPVTGMSESRQSRSRANNERDARIALAARIARQEERNVSEIRAKDKKDKLGSGERGDKIITIQFQNDRVTNHITGKTCRVKEFLNGHMEKVW